MPKVVIIDKSKIEEMSEITFSNGFYTYKKSRYSIKLPDEITEDFAYFLGVIYGDGSVNTPIKRAEGGFYKKVIITCRKDFLNILLPLIERIFSFKPRVYKDKRKKDCYNVTMHSSVIYHFLTDVIGLGKGKKAGNLIWLDNLELTRGIFRNFVTGLLDTDGYINKRYACIVQKDKIYLEKLKLKMNEILDLKFNGPYINKKINDVPICWWIRTDNVREVLNKIPLRYKGRVAQLG